MAAVHTVRGLIAAKITSIGQTPLEYRDENDAIPVEDLPGVLIEEGDTDIARYEGQAGGTAWHQTTFFFTFAARSGGGQTGREIAYNNLAAAVAAFADDYSLAGQIQNFTVLKYGGEGEMGNDAAAVLMEALVEFCTPNNDFNTLI